ncbi:hypothetical protein [Streptomyces sp. ISL-43]|uniref:hypothetical protein n=1 Tax=Streptomyces sp. ISL-43 TaxID=2819183 RepID=UPI001BE74AA0|nr:hypothetical protein [Streptomyces sp. ISL-43]
MRAEGALIDWAYLDKKGPEEASDHAAWDHARGLARVILTLVRVVRTQQSASIL